MVEPMPQPDPLQQLLAPRGGSVPLLASTTERLPDQVGHHHVFQRRQLGKQVIELEDEAERRVPHRIAMPFGPVVDALAVDQHRPRIGGVEQAQDVEEGALAGPARPPRRRPSRRARPPGRPRAEPEPRSAPSSSSSPDRPPRYAPAIVLSPSWIMSVPTRSGDRSDHSNRKAFTGCRLAARWAGQMLASTAIKHAPRPRSRSRYGGTTWVGILSK